MAFNLKEMSLPMQAFVFALLAVGLIAAGIFTPLSPIQENRLKLQTAQAEVSSLQQKVAGLEAVKRKLGEVRSNIDGLQKEIANLRNIVPEEKDVDGFIRTLHEAANASSVSIRRLTAKSVVAKELYAEMPFEMEVDGPYYNIQEFFGRLGEQARIINVGDLNFSAMAEGRAKKLQVRPGTTVSGTFTATTFFTKAATGLPPEKQAGKPGAAAPAGSAPR
jgi:type IV pilus assembly protein PilO